MYDSNLLLIKQTVAAVVANSPITGTGKNIGPSLVPETWLIYVPTVATTTTPVMVVTIQESDDDSTYYTVSTTSITAAGLYFDTVVCTRKYRRAVLTITGTSADFGLVVVGRVPAGHYTKY